jgi:hypothetical protein
LLFLLLYFSSWRERERERTRKRKILNTSKSTQLSSFVSRLFFLLIPFCLFYAAIHLFVFILQSIVSHIFTIVCWIK